MNTLFQRLVVAGLVVLSVGSASAGVTVAYLHPENYPDMPISVNERDRLLKELSDYFVSLGKRLPPGQELRVEVVDLDLAGTIRHSFRGREDVRVVRGGADWPRMVVRYELVSNGQVIAKGEDKLSDMQYTDRINRYGDGDTLRYEKRMIYDWFTQKFVPGNHG